MMRTKKPKPIKLPRPRVKELRKLYQGLITPSISLRIEALKTILQWYNQSMPYVDQKIPLDLDRAKLKEKMLKARRIEISRGATGAESETAFLTAIRICESYCKILRPPPIDKTHEGFEMRRARLLARQKKMEIYFHRILEMLRVLKPTLSTGEPIRITVAVQGQRKKLGFTTAEFLYSREAIKHCRTTLRQKGLLPLVVQEIKSLSHAAAQRRNADGHFILDPVLQVESIFQMLDSFITYCQKAEAPNRLIRREISANGSKAASLLDLGAKSARNARYCEERASGEGSEQQNTLKESVQ